MSANNTKSERQTSIMTPPVENVPEPCPACQPFVVALQTSYMRLCEEIETDAKALEEKIGKYRKWFPHYYERRAGTSTSRSLVAVLNLANQIGSNTREALAIQECLKLFNQTATNKNCPSRAETKRKMLAKIAKKRG